MMFESTSDFIPSLSERETGAYSTLALAHVGDAVYELMMRTALCTSGVTAASSMHRETVRRVNASAQMTAAVEILKHLTEEELSVYKRGRNAKVNAIPHHSNAAEYHAATGLETLFGWLWLQGKTDRLKQLFNFAMEVL